MREDSMKSKFRAGTALVALALVASTVAFAGGASGFQMNQETPSAVTDDSVAESDSVNESESVCDGEVNAKLPGNCKVHITVVPHAVDTEDDLAGFIVRNDGHGGDDSENLTYRYETSEGESGTAGFGYTNINASDDGSVTLRIYYDVELVTEVQSDTDTVRDLGPDNDGNDDSDSGADDGQDGSDDSGEQDDSNESDEQDDCS
ncbi:hypothetical protein [Haladaptatus sp. DFWS20]|uniref:hypothetical protein n=1 Tax=Haladaptatus sp. DFWS20 TaxID=3403467 RepID=UPI003EB8207C